MVKFMVTPQSWTHRERLHNGEKLDMCQEVRRTPALSTYVDHISALPVVIPGFRANLNLAEPPRLHLHNRVKIENCPGLNMRLCTQSSHATSGMEQLLS